MKYSQATNYALHTMLYFVSSNENTTYGLQQLAIVQEQSPSYLSKILTKLVKAGLIESTPGVNGGYRLAKVRDEISFLEVIEAIEGTASLFNCSSGQQHRSCAIQHVMHEAEDQLESYLAQRKLIELAPQMSQVLERLEQAAS